MKRWLFLAFLLTIGVIVWKSQTEEIKVTEQPSLLLTKKQLATKMVKEQKKVIRTPAQMVQKPTLGHPPLSRSLEKWPKDETVQGPKGFTILKGISALPKEQYRSQIGDKLHEDRFFVYFRPSSEQEEAWPVAYHPGTKGFYPVSHILHLKKIDSTEREALLSEGLNEYYYHSRMQLFSVETTPGTVLAQYRDLKSRGFEVTLEVLKDVHQKR